MRMNVACSLSIQHEERFHNPRIEILENGSKNIEMWNYRKCIENIKGHIR